MNLHFYVPISSKLRVIDFDNAHDCGNKKPVFFTIYLHAYVRQSLAFGNNIQQKGSSSV